MKQFSFPVMNRAYLVANFVTTIDGKIAGRGQGYWPIGSASDLAMLRDLRASCGAVVQGRQTALSANHVERLSSEDFVQLLRKHGRTDPYVYVVMSAHPDAVLL